MQIDIVVLQEAEKRLPPRTVALPYFLLDEAGLQIVDLCGADSLGWHGNGLMWNDDVIQEWQFGYHDLPGLEPFGVVRVEFDTQIGSLREMGMHVGLLSVSRRQQIDYNRCCDSDLE